jgi:hypothetical protein
MNERTMQCCCFSNQEIFAIILGLSFAVLRTYVGILPVLVGEEGLGVFSGAF